MWKYPKVEDLYVDDNVYVFSRGPFVIVMTNVGEAGPTTVTNNTVITIPRLPKRFHSSRLRNIYDKQVRGWLQRVGLCVHKHLCMCVQCVWRGRRSLAVALGATCAHLQLTSVTCYQQCYCQPQDKMEVGKTGTAMFELDPKGRPQVFYFGNIREPASFEAHSKVGLGVWSKVWCDAAAVVGHKCFTACATTCMHQTYH